MRQQLFRYGRFRSFSQGRMLVDGLGRHPLQYADETIMVLAVWAKPIVVVFLIVFFISEYDGDVWMRFFLLSCAVAFEAGCVVAATEGDLGDDNALGLRRCIISRHDLPKLWDLLAPLLQ